MSCSTLNQQPVRMTVSAGALPEGFCPSSMQELFDAMVQRLIVTPNQVFTSFAQGSVEPTSNVGPWLKDCETWFVWDDTTARYQPIAKGDLFACNIAPWEMHAFFVAVKGVYLIGRHAGFTAAQCA